MTELQRQLVLLVVATLLFIASIGLPTFVKTLRVRVTIWLAVLGWVCLLASFIV